MANFRVRDRDFQRPALVAYIKVYVIIGADEITRFGVLLDLKIGAITFKREKGNASTWGKYWQRRGGYSAL